MNAVFGSEWRSRVGLALLVILVAVAGAFAYDVAVIQPRSAPAEGLLFGGYGGWQPAQKMKGLTVLNSITDQGSLAVKGASTLTGAATAETGLTITSGGETITAGNLTLSDGVLAVTEASNTGTSEEGANVQITQANGVTLTGTLRGAYVVATNGTTEATGTIRGIEAKARAANSSNEGATVATLEGASIDADSKDENVTLMRGMEVILDGASGTVGTAVGVEIDNNSSGTQTTSYAVSVNQGTAAGHKAFTADVRLQNGETVDNSTDGTVNIGGTSPVLAIGGVAFSGPMKYGTSATYTSGASITHGFSVTPTVCILSPLEITATLTITSTGFSSDTADHANPVYWMCGK